MNPFKRIIQVVKTTAAAKKDFDFSAFVPATPLTRKQLLIEECKKQDVPICVDDPLEQSAGDYAIFRSVASEAELERRLNAQKTFTFSAQANVIALLALIVSALAFAKSFL